MIGPSKFFYPDILRSRKDVAPMGQKSCFLQCIKNFTFFVSKTYEIIKFGVYVEF